MEKKSHVGMGTCFICGEVKELILDTRLENTLPREACYNKEPCNKCKELMKQGIIVISVEDGESGDNPHRTGGWWVIKEDALLKIGVIPENLKKRVVFIEDSAAEKIGLIKKEVVNEKA